MITSKLKLIGIGIGLIGLATSYIAVYFYGKQVSETEWQASKAQFEEQVRKEQKELDEEILMVREAAFRQRLAEARQSSVVEKEVVRYVEKEQESGSDNVCIPDSNGVQLYTDILRGGSEELSDAESRGTDSSED